MMASKPAPNKWLVLMMITLIFIGVSGIPFSVMPVLFSSVSREINLSLAEIGIIWGLAPIGAALFALPGGLIGDRFRFRNVVGIVCFIMALANALRGLSVNFVSLAASMFLCGIAMGILVPNLPKAVASFFPPRQLGLAIGISNSGFSVGGMVATALSATVILPLVSSWRNVLFVYTAICVILGVTWFLVIRETTPQVASSTDTTSSHSPFFKSLTRVLSIKEIWLLAGASMGVIGAFVGVLGYLPVYLETTGTPKAISDTITSTIFIASIAGCILLPALSDRLRARKVILMICAPVVGLCIYLMSLSNVTFLWVLVPLTGLAAQGSVPIIFALVLENKEIGPAYRATALGLLIAFQNAGGFLFPVIGGLLAEINKTWPFIIWAILSSLSLLCLIFTKGGNRNKNTQEVTHGTIRGD